MPDPRREDQQWEELQRAWQEPPSEELPRLERLLERRSRSIWALTGIDAIGTALLLAGLVWVVAHDPTPIELAWSVFLAVLLVLVWGAVLLIRRGTWRADVAAPAAMVALSIRRCRASIRLALLNQYALFFMLALTLLIRWTGIPAPRLGFEAGILMRIGAMTFFVGWLLTAGWYKRRKREELKRLEALQEDLDPRNERGS